MLNSWTWIHVRLRAVLMYSHTGCWCHFLCVCVSFIWLSVFSVFCAQMISKRNSASSSLIWSLYMCCLMSLYCDWWMSAHAAPWLVQTIEFDEGAGAVLRIQPLRAPRDENVYECVAKNTEGEIAVTSKLSIIRGEIYVIVFIVIIIVIQPHHSPFILQLYWILQSHCRK